MVHTNGNSSTTTTADQLRSQWSNPSDILSLLLLIGGDIVQKAIAQLTGNKTHPFGQKGPCISITPVAFSFGWVAYGFSNILTVVSETRLMPIVDYPAIVVNCTNGFGRQTQSWVVGRLLRDHETKFEVDPRPKEDGGREESIRIDLFELGEASNPSCDMVWWLGWATILMQIAIAILPWIFYGDWVIIMVALSGNLLAAITCSLPQWRQEKWAGRKLASDKVTCLTRGNGHHHIMVLIGRKGSWDFESLAAGILVSRPETRIILLVLAIFWTCLLISVSGLAEHAWFLVGIGGIGMFQNIVAAGKARKPSASDFHITKFIRMPTIIGIRRKEIDDEDSQVDVQKTLDNLADISNWASKKPENVLPLSVCTPSAHPIERTSMPKWLSTMSEDDGVPPWLKPLKIEGTNVADINLGRAKKNRIVYAPNVHGALMELEKWVPTAGLAMVQVFFPTGLRYEDQSIRDNVHKKF